MKIPKYIDELIKRRVRAANMLVQTDYELYVWLEKNNIKPDESCYFGGIQVITNPENAANEVRRAIKEK